MKHWHVKILYIINEFFFHIFSCCILLLKLHGLTYEFDDYKISNLPQYGATEKKREIKKE